MPAVVSMSVSFTAAFGPTAFSSTARLLTATCCQDGADELVSDYTATREQRKQHLHHAGKCVSKPCIGRELHSVSSS